jgi:uncharacterized RDD family membrane protein YckC
MRDPRVEQSGGPSARATRPGGAPPSGRVRAWAANDGTQVPKKVASAKRFLAFVIDGAIAVALGILPFVGALLAGLYLLARDGLGLSFMDRRSVGKRILRLRPVTNDGGRLGLGASVRRNWPLAVASLAVFLGMVPVLGFFIKPVGLAIGIVLILFEGYLVRVDEGGVRWGDHLARTRVVESRS